MAGFKFHHRINGGPPTIQPIVFKDTETITTGDTVNLESGQADLGATADVNFAGVAAETKAGTSAVTKLNVYTDPDAVFAVTDANARLIGATLDVAGATGAQTVAASSNKEFVVVADCSATEPTLVRFNVAKHYQNKAQ